MFRKDSLNFKSYELYPKIDIKYDDVTRIFGNTFAVMYFRDEKLLHFYVKTPVTAPVLKQYFEVRDVKIPHDFKYFAEVKLKREREFYEVHEFNDLHSFLSSLEPGQALFTWVKLEPNLKEIHYWRLNKVQQWATQGSEKHKQMVQQLRDKLKDPLYLVKLYLFDNNRGRLKTTAKALQAYSSLRLSFEIPLFKQSPTILKILNIPPKLGLIQARLNEKKWIHLPKPNLTYLVVVPDPSIVKVKFTRSAQLPMISVERHDILIGHLEDGTPFKLDLEDFFRHVYIVGATGSGKSTTITKLVVEMKKLTNKKKAQVVIDPNHDLARDLSIYADYYFDASIPNFAVNPLQLPKVYDNREDNISLGVSISLAILEKLLGLVETAVNVKYIFQVLLSKLYGKTDSPTLSDIYELVLALRNEELDLDVNDEVFEKEVEALRQMPAQSFISLLSRLKPFVENRVLNQVTSSSTINWDEILQDNALVLFDVNKGKLGEIPSYLVQASVLTSLFYWVLQRSIKSNDRMPILTYIDEFQNVAHLPYIKEILAEARKYGMHLIMANQNLAQLEEAGVLEHVLSNTNVKFIMAQSSPRGQELAVKLDKAFSDELQEVVPNLSVGEAVVFIRARPGEKTAPTKVLVEKVDQVGNEGAVKQLASKTAEKYAPKGAEKKDSKTMLNPVLRYCEVPKPLEEYILYYIWKSKDHTAFQADLLKDLGLDRERVREVLARLQADGYVNMEKVGNKLKLQYNRGLFRLKGIVDNELGKKIAMKVMVRYLSQGYTITRGKQEGEIRPDFVAFPYDKSTFRPKYTEAIAVEIESPNEIEVHPEQVRRNMMKYIPIQNLFKEIHIWTAEEKFDKLKEIYDSFLADPSIPQDYKQKVKIFSVKLRKEIEQEGKKAQKTKPETGEFNGKSEEPESTAIVVQGAANNENKQQNEAQTIAATDGKLGSLTLKEVIIEILREDKDYAIIRIGDKQCKVHKTDLEFLKSAAKEPEFLDDVKLKENEILIQAAGTKKTILLGPA
ncbi:ATP-binding protein [Sulfolobus acidocaldarius]|uniref:ATP-binding protein n=1 Tax=Sulfolobus acidocaldarius TaxID=2285 RepID=UPI000B5A6BBF|nr:ATP-binding protein [Sulfolobus acidocaldarius]